MALFFQNSKFIINVRVRRLAVNSESLVILIKFDVRITINW